MNWLFVAIASALVAIVWFFVCFLLQENGEVSSYWFKICACMSFCNFVLCNVAIVLACLS